MTASEMMRPLPDEIWRPVPITGYGSLYEVSNLGRVRRIGNTPLTHDLNQKGYHTVRLCGVGERYRVTVHSLVLKAFKGPRPEGMVSRHLDDDKDNNTDSNLEWGTQSENVADSVRNQTHRNSAKVMCIHGHELKHPNLCNKARRECLACSRALTYCKKHSLTNLKEEADKYYNMIMRGLGHIDRRRWNKYE